ncbi:hypothetical protein HK102_000810 [Quaeritorhiza haematococci]|nr:hypothetical protein HK102_000810 [Quaeritorhiza haematococci]
MATTDVVVNVDGSVKLGPQTEAEHPTTQLTVHSIRHPELFHTSKELAVSGAGNQLTVKSLEEYTQEFEKINMEAIELAWKDIAVFAGDNTLLSEASGKVQGRFLAIMGPSGSGKTTLMNTLARRNNNARWEGTTRLDGADYSNRELKQCSGYVMQDDLLNGYLTVEETLYYASELRLPSTLTKEEKQKRIDEVIKEVGLEHARHTIVGDALRRGISGGERKRLCVALELLTHPRLLFLDEPTSGLDSVTALSLCETLKKLAASGKCTVITTIHQPQSRIFALFDDLLLLKGGKVMYYGVTKEVLTMYAEAGFPLPPETNPADHILDVITLPNYQDVTGSRTNEHHLPEHKLHAIQQQMQKEITIDDAGHKHTKTIPHAYKHRPTWRHQFLVLLERCWKEYLRAWGVIVTQVLQNLLLAILIGFVFFQIGDGQPSVIRRLPVLFFCTINQGIFSSLATINSFPSERVLVLRERAAGTYYASAYFLAKNLAEGVFQIVSPIVFSCIVYFIVGLHMSAAKFFTFMGFMILCSVAATSLALMVSALCRTTTMSVTVLPMMLELARLFGGWFLSPANLPKYFVWLDSISYVKYTYIGIALNELTGLTLKCPNPDGTGCVLNGDFTIQQQGFQNYSVAGCAGALVAYIFICRFIAYLGIRYIKW